MPSYKGPLSNKHIDKNVTTQTNFIYPFLGFVIVTAIIVFTNEEKKSLVIKLIKSKTFMFSLICVIIYSVWTLNDKSDDEETDRRKRATREAILGFIIAILAYLDLKVAPFWIIWLVSYYLDK